MLWLTGSANHRPVKLSIQEYDIILLIHVEGVTEWNPWLPPLLVVPVYHIIVQHVTRLYFLRCR